MPIDESTSGAPRARVLIVDDEEGILRTFRRILEPLYEVVTSACPTAALTMLTTGPTFDAVVCDVRMPGMTGLELHAALRESAQPVADRFLFVTATPPEAPALSGAPVLSKPVRRAELLEAVRRIAKRCEPDSRAVAGLGVAAILSLDADRVLTFSYRD